MKKSTKNVSAVVLVGLMVGLSFGTVLASNSISSNGDETESTFVCPNSKEGCQGQRACQRQEKCDQACNKERACDGQGQKARGCQNPQMMKSRMMDKGSSSKPCMR